MVLEPVAWGISIAGWIMSPIVSRLLDKCVSFLESDKDNTVVRLFNDILPRLKIALQEAQDSPQREELRKMVSDLKSAFYDIEDLLDDVEYHHHKKKIEHRHKKQLEQSNGKAGSNDKAGPSTQDIQIAAEWTLPARLNHALKKKMCDVEKLIAAAKKIKRVAELASKDETVTVKKKKKKKETERTGSVSPWKVTGRDKDRDTIKQMLREDVNPSSSNGTHLSAIGIYGVSGSGKTTLAQHVCVDEKTAGHFDFVMWIHVSQKFSMWDIYKDMYAASVREKEPPRPSENLDILQQELEKKLENKRVLLVLDDIWCIKHVGKDLLPQLISPFKAAKSGSKILATSCTADAFSELGPDVTCIKYLIPVLKEKEFLELFMYYAIGNVNVDDDPDLLALKGIGADIALKLKGSPLAARTVGGWLRKTQTDEYWITVLEQNLLNETVGTLWWSYQNLDEQVRRCFAYCSIFPRRYRFERDELVRLWAAEGFINTSDTKLDMDAVGWDYFRQLLSISFMQPAVEPTQGSTVEYFEIHDLIHDLAATAAGSDCFGFKNGLAKDVRHLFVENEQDIDKICEFSNLRTLIISDFKWAKTMDRQTLEKILSKLQKLRVLKIEHMARYGEREFSIPECITELKHLRYLGLRVLYIAELNLPEKINTLYHMQVLNICTDNLTQVSNVENMSDLTNLRHVIGPSNGNFAHIGRLQSLQTLENFHVESKVETHGQSNMALNLCTPWGSYPRRRGYELGQLSELNLLRGMMTISGLENVESKVEARGAKLVDKKHLTGLVLEWSDRVSDTTRVAQVQEEVLEGLCPPKYLRCLCIESYPGERYPTWMVKKESAGPNCLHDLYLWHCRRLVLDPRLFDVFCTLRYLSISGCNWDSLPGNLENLKWLETLNISYCHNLQLLPNLPRSLKKFQLVSCDEEFMKSCETPGHPNWEKIQHFADKRIDYS